MSGPTSTESQLRRELDALRERAGPADTDLDDVRVEWRDAAPDERPAGMTWQPATDDAPATLAYDVWDAQRETLDAVDSGDHDIVAFLAGYGSGKSVLGARWLIDKALSNPGSRFLCMGQDFQKAKNTTYPKLFEALPGGGTRKLTSGVNGPERSPIVEDFNRQDYRLTLANDSVITLGSADSYERYAGAEFGAVWMDEPSHYGEVLHDLTGMITTRLRGVDGPKVQLWTLTGEGYNAAWEILEQRQNADGDPIGLNIEVLTASVLDNPYATERELEMFRRQYEGTEKEQQALHSGFAAASGRVYANFSRETHEIPHAEALDRVAGDWRIYGYDAGWNDPRVLLEIAATDYGQFIVVDEFHRSGSHVDDALAWLRANDKPSGRIYCEHEPADIQKFNGAGYSASRAEKSIDSGIAEVRRRLDRDESGRPGLLVSAQCEHTIREFLGYKEEHIGTASATDHCLDATRYALYTHEYQGNDPGGESKTVRRTGSMSDILGSGGFP